MVQNLHGFPSVMVLWRICNKEIEVAAYMTQGSLWYKLFAIICVIASQ